MSGSFHLITFRHLLHLDVSFLYDSLNQHIRSTSTRTMFPYLLNHPVIGDLLTTLRMLSSCILHTSGSYPVRARTRTGVMLPIVSSNASPDGNHDGAAVACRTRTVRTCNRRANHSSWKATSGSVYSRPKIERLRPLRWYDSQHEAPHYRMTLFIEYTHLDPLRPVAMARLVLIQRQYRQGAGLVCTQG